MTPPKTSKPIESDIILIRYGEIYLKSSYVRNQFEHTLMTNIHNHCKTHAITATVTRDKGRLYLQTNNIPQALIILSTVFGITSFNSATTTTASQEDITTTATQILNPLLTNKTSFALRVTRTGSHPYTSQDIAIQVGNTIVNTTHAPVDLTTPDKELYIEIRHKHAFLFTQKIPGPGGLPLGTQGHVLIIIDTPQSLLAAWHLMKRGCTPHFLLTTPQLQKNLTSFLTKWYPTSTPSIHLLQKDPLFDTITHYAKKHKCDAIITGHTLTNDSDIQTLHHYKTHLHLPVLHPLIAKSPQDLQQQIQEVGICF